VQVLYGITLPKIRHEVVARVEKIKEESNIRHLLYEDNLTGI